MHVGWKNCPTAWAGQFTGKEKEPTIVLEAVATKDRWIWHSFFGTPGTNNDINILDQSPLFDRVLNGTSSMVQFELNGTQFNSGYYLCDGIYPSWATFVKSIPNASDMATKHFNTVQEAVRKDIERAFGGLQSKWHILTRPIRFWYQGYIKSIVLCCIILHNMMVEEGVSDFVRDSPSTQALPSFSIIPATLTNTFDDRRRVANQIRSERVHRELTVALIKYQWEQKGITNSTE
ncbi:hypothetical protein Pst134EA_033456 [Puccinia striiformis f. sp. tritici]|uniref:hypothetical protein n=1 Tax=Puccinia striiformis f. sp. tritici TaxID=168172 RepID=UPI002008616B|nr:hypothetical protein Pst134EA_033456 [Puccinia striiformis f. sp. tritici]KAH9465918.1 hypothetical protein Pst134EA_033456 [Puccinia striiformis f. sp. tritici]